MIQRHLFFISCVAIVIVASLSANADDYVDDVYYSEDTALKEELSKSTLSPYYNKKNMEELIFLPDSVPSDTTGTTVPVK